jgi:hypothetical protein
MINHLEKKNSIRKAVMDSLERIIQSGQKVTKASVIAGAVREDGSSIGKTTLYSRSDTSKALVHADLIKDIELARQRQLKGAGRKTKYETIVGTKNKLATFKDEHLKCLGLIVSQQEQIRMLSLSDNKDRNALSSSEGDIYVLSVVLNEVVRGAIPELKRPISVFSDKYAGTERLKVANLSVGRYLRAIKCSMPVTLNEFHELKVPDKS